MLRQVLGFIVALFGLGSVATGLYLFLTQPLIQGDPNGVMVKAVLSGIFGFFVILLGYGILDPKAFEGKSSQSDGEETGDGESGAKG
jgi:hypothetical protein